MNPIRVRWRDPTSDLTTPPMHDGVAIAFVRSDSGPMAIVQQGTGLFEMPINSLIVVSAPPGTADGVA